LATISASNAYNPNRIIDCCRKMLAQWLREIPSPSWGKLDDAINNIKPLTISPAPTVSGDPTGNYKIYKEIYIM